ncbi:single-stranded DNA-binding protein [Bacteroides sp.]|uniref:single-stranded DNA-binding protein n=1 Tax=Bacteroides sp. TaxID=29523 RepID=UPI0025BEB265|nr:single-stranded DNA-binding protein [Bacteroides sp.]
MSVNKVILLGNVGKDPEVRYLDTGIAVATFPLATTDRAYTLANGTQVPERTEWHNLVLWRGLAETAEKYVHKGDKLYIEGKIRSRSYDDQTGAKRYITEIFVDNMEMLTPKNTASGTSASTPAAQQGAPTVQPQQSQASPIQNNPADDLPF